MEGWVNIGDLIALRPGVVPVPLWSKVQRPNRQLYSSEAWYLASNNHCTTNNYSLCEHRVIVIAWPSLYKLFTYLITYSTIVTNLFVGILISVQFAPLFLYFRYRCQLVPHFTSSSWRAGQSTGCQSVRPSVCHSGLDRWLFCAATVTDARWFALI